MIYYTSFVALALLAMHFVPLWIGWPFDPYEPPERKPDPWWRPDSRYKVTDEYRCMKL